MPKVSVIIPVYGVEKHIERCARSLFEQTLDDIEYLFIDDCTPDKSIEILKNVLEYYPNRKDQVIIHRMEQNSGQAAVRKWGMQNASGEFVIHCDSDDWIPYDAYLKMYSAAKQNNYDILVADYTFIKGSQCRYVKGCSTPCNKDSLLKDILTVKYSSSLWNKMIKRSKYDTLKFVYPAHNMGEDLVIVVQCILNCQTVGSLSCSTYNYVYNQNSIVNNPQKVMSNFEDIISNIQLSCSFFTNDENEYKEEFTCLKERKRDVFIDSISNHEMYKKWKRTFPEINTRIFFNKYITFKEKLRFLKTYIGIIRYE